MKTFDKPVLELARDILREIAITHDLIDAPVCVRARILSPFEAIGEPERKDFPITEGREKVIEAHVLGSRGQAFTDSPAESDFTLNDILLLPLINNRNRAFFIAGLNALLRHLDKTDRTVHCKDNEPELCAGEISAFIEKKFNGARVGLIGYNPAIADALIDSFGPENVSITDLNEKNFQKTVKGTTILDGGTATETLIEKSQVVVITGTTMVNDTFDSIFNLVQEQNKDYVVYGVTSAGVCTLLGLNRICPYGKDA